ncbi:MAG: metallophosphoesterase, partial [Bacteroidales bacterium]
FLILGDSHANIGRTSVLLDSAVNKLKSLYGTDLHDCLDMILHTGDITNDGSTISDYMNLFFRPFSSLSPYIPMLLVPGSNEMEHPYFYEYILNEDISAQPKGHPDYMRYWAKKVKNVLFIGLNSYSESFDAIAQSRVPGLDERQVAWLREILDQTASDGTIDMVFCLVHECPVSELGRQGAGAYVSQQLYPLLRQYPKVKQISYGHTHAYERGVSQPLDDHAQEDLVLLCNGNSGCDLDRWNTPGYIQKDQPEISVALDHWCFTVGEIDGDNKCFKFDTYSLGNTDYKLHSEKADHWYGNLNQSAPDMPQGLSFEEGPDNEWSFTCGPFVGEGSLYSTQFQLLKEKDQEQTVILNSLRDRQNIFGVDADFVPVDQHETIDILTLKTVLNNLDMDYSYSSRVRFRDDNRKWSEWSDPQKLSFATTLNKPASDSFSVFNEQGASRIHLVFTDDNNRTLIISDMAGKIIMQRMIEGEQFTWSYTGMPKGIYVITAGSGSQTVQAKVRIE